MNLFTKSEQILLSKFDTDYLHSPTEELIENFTMKNLETIEEQNKSNQNSHSLILAPFNTHESDDVNIFNDDIEIENNICYFGRKVKQENIKYELNNNEDFDNGVIITQSEEEENKSKDKSKSKEKEKKISKNSSTLSLNANSPKNKSENSFNLNIKDDLNFEEDIQIIKASNKRKNEYIQEQAKTKEGTSSLSGDNYNSIIINENLINEIEYNIGYDKNYLINAIKTREVNYATATYYLLNKENYQSFD
ncbi:MAG: hypothetical protein MJ252_10590 [archaeon]|nr:hypothetical protein [archaeon]